MQSSQIHFAPAAPPPPPTRAELRARQLRQLERMKAIFEESPSLKERFKAVTAFAAKVRPSEYHLTNACNLRCKGCWFFEYGHNRETREVTDLETLEDFLKRERQRRVTSALVIGGEPALFLDRLTVFARQFDYLTISTNGLKKIPLALIPKATIGITIFGGGPLDDELRGVKPNGKRFSGLFHLALENYSYDPRAGFIYAVTEDGIRYVERTVKAMRDNGNIMNFNYYTSYGATGRSGEDKRRDLLAECLRVKKLYPETIVSHPYYIEAMITGRSHWGEFGYQSCPSISADHPAHAGRLANGNPALPVFNTWSADLATVKFCCTGGHCDGCRDSQAVFSWLLVSAHHFLDNAEQFGLWLEIAESYWSQFYYSPYHRFADQFREKFGGQHERYCEAA